MSKAPEPVNGYVEIFCKHFFHRGLGRRVFAYEKGLEAFRFRIPVEKYKSPETYHKEREKEKALSQPSGETA